MKLVLGTCREHPTCTVRAEFHDAGDPSVDVTMDRVAIPDWVRKAGSREFPGAVCTDLRHQDGILEIHQSEG